MTSYPGARGNQKQDLSKKWNALSQILKLGRTMPLWIKLLVEQAEHGVLTRVSVGSSVVSDSLQSHGYLLIYFWLKHTELPWLGIEPVTPAVEAQRLHHWTTREVLRSFLFSSLSLCLFSLHCSLPMHYFFSTFLFWSFSSLQKVARVVQWTILSQLSLPAESNWKLHNALS